MLGQDRQLRTPLGRLLGVALQWTTQSVGIAEPLS